MKLLSASLGLMALAYGADQYAANPHIYYDCHQESRVFGKNEGIKVTDKDLISGLSTLDHRMVQIAGCVDNSTKTLTGVVTTWAKWVNGVQTDILRMNLVGTMSSVYSFDNNGPLTLNGQATLTAQQLLAFEPYWFQEAHPDQEEAYLARKASNLDVNNATIWRNSRIGLFNAADIDNNGSLTKTEAFAFLRSVRVADGKTGVTQTEDYQLERHWNVLSLLSPTADTMTFDDYVRVETIMELWYANGKLAATGHAYGNVYEFDENDPNKYYLFGDKLTTHCHILNLEENDQITYALVQSGDYGVNRIELQTIENPYFSIGYEADSWYAYENQNWRRYDDGYQLSGIFGYTNPVTGKMNSIGFVEQDVACTNKFISGVTRAALQWTSTLPGTAAILPAVPEGLELDVLPSPTPRHQHDKEVDPGLVVVCILVYVMIAMLLLAFIVQYCKEKKEGLGVAPGRGKYSAE